MPISSREVTLNPPPRESEIKPAKKKPVAEKIGPLGETPATKKPVAGEEVALAVGKKASVSTSINSSEVRCQQHEAGLAKNAFEPWVPADTVALYIGIERREVMELTRAEKLPGHPVDPNATRKRWRYKLSEVDVAMHGIRRPTRAGVVPKEGSLHNDHGSPRSRRG